MIPEEHSRQIFSQEGEDGVIEAILEQIGTTNRYFVEFGVGDGRVCNCRYLLEQGWRGLMMDADPGRVPGSVVQSHVRTEHVTAENINDLLDKYGVPAEFDVLSIDIDGNDYWVWKAIARRPRLIVIEYNAKWRPPVSAVIPYDPGRKFQSDDYYGATLQAYHDLGRAKGYTLVACDLCGVNAYFVLDHLAGYFAPRSVAEIYRPFGFDTPPVGVGPWIDLDQR